MDERTALSGAGLEPLNASTIRVSRTIKKDDPEIIEEETLEVHKFQTCPAMVSITLGGTVNLGDYQSSRFSVTVSKPCYSEEVDDAYDVLKEDVLKKAMDIITEFRLARG